jgi:hypothetical protein
MVSLLGIEALRSMIGIRSLSVNLLDETNHGLTADGVERLVVTSLGALKSIATILEWVLTNTWLNVISKVSDESGSIIKLNSHGLIINCAPGATHTLTWALSLCDVVWEQLHLPYLFLLELELVASVHNLDMIWPLVGANLLCLEKVYGLHICRDMEVPLTVGVIPEAMDGLISSHEVGWGQVKY